MWSFSSETVTVMLNIYHDLSDVLFSELEEWKLIPHRYCVPWSKLSEILNNRTTRYTYNKSTILVVWPMLYNREALIPCILVFLVFIGTCMWWKSHIFVLTTSILSFSDHSHLISLRYYTCIHTSLLWCFFILVFIKWSPLFMNASHTSLFSLESIYFIAVLFKYVLNEPPICLSIKTCKFLRYACTIMCSNYFVTDSFFLLFLLIVVIP